MPTFDYEVGLRCAPFGLESCSSESDEIVGLIEFTAEVVLNHGDLNIYEISTHAGPAIEGQFRDDLIEHLLSDRRFTDLAEETIAVEAADDEGDYHYHQSRG